MKLTVLVLIEVTYAILTRVVMPPYFPNEVGQEAATTLVRIATIPLYWVFFRDVIGRVTPDGKSIRQKLFWVGVAFLVLVPVVVPSHSPFSNASAAAFFALTSFVVGLREELVYRGVLQNLLERKWGIGAALVVSNVGFVVYHIGALPITRASILEVFVGGCILGVIYAGSRSLVVASLVHGVYDAIECLGPYVQNPVPGWSLIVLEVAALAILARWMWRNAHLQS